MTEVAESARPPRRFRRYPEYKSSGVAWLGDLPSHWKPKRFKFACSRSALYGANESAESYSLDGIRFLRTTDIDDSGSLVDDGAVYLPEELVQDYLLSDGDILISRSGTLGRALHYQRDVHGPCAYAGYLVRFVPKPTLDPRFAFYFTKSKVFMGWLSVSAIQSTIGNINGQKYGNLHLPDPALGEQRAIADFLDRETARIDQLIEKKQRMVEAIKAKVSDFADLAVTHGLVDSVEFRDALMPWIDAVPRHWQVVRGKYLFRQMSRPPLPDDGVITAFRDGQVCLRSNRRTEGYTFAELEVGYQHISKGDFVIHTMDAFAGAIGVSEDDGKSTGEYAVCTPIGDHNATYFAYVLRCMAKRDYISVLCPSVRERAPRFRFVRFAPVFLPVPPKSEQDRIVDAIEDMKSGLGVVQLKTSASIDRLKEYRAALITAAVTGQIDVSTWGKQGTSDRRLDRIKEATSA